MSKKLFILRHAHTEPFSQNGKDFARALTIDGFNDADKMGKRIASQAFTIDHVICSTATRTQQTLETIWPYFGETAPQSSHEDSAYLASHEDLLSFIQELPDEYDSVMIIGHNPGLHQLVQILSGAALTQFSPCTLAVLETAGSWGKIEANSMKLAELITP